MNLGCWAAFRFVAGVGIGGEYSAINSAIDELIPSHYRGRVDIAINGTYWGGAAIGAVGEPVPAAGLRHPAICGWRIGFFIGPVLGVLIICLRRHIPESPRWQMTHGHQDEAKRTVDDIEEQVAVGRPQLSDVDEKGIEIVDRSAGCPTASSSGSSSRPTRGAPSLGFSLMATQAFLYNAIFFTYALVLQHFFHVSKAHTSYYFCPSRSATCSARCCSARCSTPSAGAR